MIFLLVMVMSYYDHHITNIISWQIVKGQPTDNIAQKSYQLTEVEGDIPSLEKYFSSSHFSIFQHLKEGFNPALLHCFSDQKVDLNVFKFVSLFEGDSFGQQPVLKVCTINQPFCWSQTVDLPLLWIVDN